MMRYFPTELYAAATLAELVDEQLHIWQEPSLSAPDVDGLEAYRCVLMPERHPRIMARAVRHGGRQLVYGKLAYTSEATGEYTNRRNARPGELSQREWSDLTRVIERTGYWNLKTYPGHDGSIGGALWVVEARRGDEYHVVMRDNPAAGDPTVVICLRLMALSGILVQSD